MRWLRATAPRPRSLTSTAHAEIAVRRVSPSRRWRRHCRVLSSFSAMFGQLPCFDAQRSSRRGRRSQAPSARSGPRRRDRRSPGPRRRRAPRPYSGPWRCNGEGFGPFPWPADSLQFTACDPVANCAQACRNATANNAKRSSTTRPPPPFRGGSEFKADFERECRNRGLLPFPEINGHVERNNGAWRYCSMTTSKTSTGVPPLASSTPSDLAKPCTPPSTPSQPKRSLHLICTEPEHRLDSLFQGA